MRRTEMAKKKVVRTSKVKMPMEKMESSKADMMSDAKMMGKGFSKGGKVKKGC
jgi:predicted outer membrane protein